MPLLRRRRLLVDLSYVSGFRVQGSGILNLLSAKRTTLNPDP